MRYGWYRLEIWLSFTWNMSRIFLIYTSCLIFGEARDRHKICLIYNWDKPRYGWDRRKIWLGYVQYILEICLRCAWYISKMSLKYSWDLLYNCWWVWKNLTPWLSENMTSREAIASKKPPAEGPGPSRRKWLSPSSTDSHGGD